MKYVLNCNLYKDLVNDTLTTAKSSMGYQNVLYCLKNEEFYLIRLNQELLKKFNLDKRLLAENALINKDLDKCIVITSDQLKWFSFVSKDEIEVKNNDLLGVLNDIIEEETANLIRAKSLNRVVDKRKQIVVSILNLLKSMDYNVDFLNEVLKQMEFLDCLYQKLKKIIEVKDKIGEIV